MEARDTGVTSQPGSPEERAHQVRTMSAVRWAGVAFAVVQVLTFYRPYPGETFELALGLVAVLFLGNLVIGAILLFGSPSTSSKLVMPSLALDVAVITA